MDRPYQNAVFSLKRAGPPPPRYIFGLFPALPIVQSIDINRDTKTTCCRSSKQRGPFFGPFCPEIGQKSALFVHFPRLLLAAGSLQMDLIAQVFNAHTSLGPDPTSNQAGRIILAAPSYSQDLKIAPRHAPEIGADG